VPSEIISAIADTVTPASRAQALAMGQRLEKRGGRQLGALYELATALASARHSPHPQVAQKRLVICCADHGVADPGVDLGSDSPTCAGLRQVVEGKAAVASLASSAKTQLLLVDCGVRGADRFDLGPGVIDLRITNGSGDIRRGPALNIGDAARAIQTGVALCYSLADDGLDVLALGSIAPGGYPSTAALIATLTGTPAGDIDDGDDAVAAALAANPVTADDPLEALAALGSCDVAMLAGLILGAASINVPVVLDADATTAAALVAVGLAPGAAGYLIASHGGGNPAHRAALTALQLTAVFDLGLAQGEGAGAAMILPFLDRAAELISAD